MNRHPSDLHVAVASSGGDAPRCSFCGKSADQVVLLVEGMGDARICDNCAELVVEMTDDEKSRDNRREVGLGSD